MKFSHNEQDAKEMEAIIASQTSILDSAKGRTIKEINIVRGDTGASVFAHDGDRIDFFFTEGPPLRMYHERDCCEQVWIEDIAGDPEDLIGSPLLLAEVACAQPIHMINNLEVHRWTFYKFGTNKGYVTVRWCGSSNGFYSVAIKLQWL